MVSFIEKELAGITRSPFANIIPKLKLTLHLELVLVFINVYLKLNSVLKTNCTFFNYKNIIKRKNKKVK